MLTQWKPMMQESPIWFEAPIRNERLPKAHVCDLNLGLTQVRNEPAEPFYHVELPDLAKPAFITWTKSYFGTGDDLSRFLSLHAAKERNELYTSLKLTPVHVLKTARALFCDYAARHLNTYGFPHIMNGKTVESVHVWLKHEDRYYRVVCARILDLTLTLEDEDLPPLTLQDSWGLPHIIGYDEPYIFNRLYEVEKIFRTMQEVEDDMKRFELEPDIILTEFFNDILGDG